VYLCRGRQVATCSMTEKNAAQNITRDRNRNSPPTSTHQPTNPPIHQSTSPPAHQPTKPQPTTIPILLYERQPALHKLLRTTTRTLKTCHFFRPSSISSSMSSIVSQLAIKLHAEKKSIVGSINLRTNFHLSRQQFADINRPSPRSATAPPSRAALPAVPSVPEMMKKTRNPSRPVSRPRRKSALPLSPPPPR
jgi:hypothetical protein